jgi:hypothetical protein
MVLRRASSAGGRDIVTTGLDTAARPRAPSAAALRMRRHRERWRDDMRCMTIELRNAEVTALIRRGFLKEDARLGDDPLKPRPLAPCKNQIFTPLIGVDKKQGLRAK